MPFILSKIISQNEKPLWGEGNPYTTTPIYSLENCCSGPEVHYDAHVIKPHSLPHVDAPAHIIKNAFTIDQFFGESHTKAFFGSTVLVKIKHALWEPCSVAAGNFVYRLPLEQLKELLAAISPKYLNAPPARLLLDVDDNSISNAHGYDHRYATVLSEEAAGWLVSTGNFLFYGTAYKSTDYMPGKSERPIHRTLFTTGLVSECLQLFHAPAGEYFMVAFPIPLKGAAESPVCPVLFNRDELIF